VAGSLSRSIGQGEKKQKYEKNNTFFVLPIWDTDNRIYGKCGLETQSAMKAQNIVEFRAN